MKPEILIVGAGISGAAAAAVLKEKYRVVILDQRAHLGGNCYDYLSQGTYIHRYGCHIWHSPGSELHEWVSKFTEWVPYGPHYVTAEVSRRRETLQAPFPYSGATAKILGSLSDQEIIDTFFKGYSEKMWGTPWEQLPDSIKNRLPKRQVQSDFFPEQITALPKKGYTHLIENMIDGCEVLLGVGPEDWYTFSKSAKYVIYCGRLDLLKGDRGGRLGAEFVDRPSLLTAWLEHRNLEFKWGTNAEPLAPTAVLNFCHRDTQAIRAVRHAQLTGGNSEIHHYEFPVGAPRLDPSPFYPMPETPRSRVVMEYLRGRVRTLYPNLHALGRLGENRYLDMHAAVGSGRALGISLLQDC